MRLSVKEETPQKASKDTLVGACKSNSIAVDIG